MDLTQNVAGLVGQQLDDGVGQEKMSSDVEPGDGSGNRGGGGASVLAALHVSPVEDKQGHMFGGPEVGDIYSVGTDFYFRMPDLRRLDEEVDELMGSDVPTARGTCCCLPTPMTLASGGSPMFPLVVHQPASPSIWPAVQSLRRGLSTNPGATMWCVCGCS